MPNLNAKPLRDELAKIIGESRQHKRVGDEQKIIEPALKVDQIVPECS